MFRFTWNHYQALSKKNIDPLHSAINPLTPNDPYRGRTAPLTSKRCILYNYYLLFI